MTRLDIKKCSGDWQLSCDGLGASCRTRTYTSRKAAIDQMILHLWDHASDTAVITIEEL